jgi:hypothetical protein
MSEAAMDGDKPCGYCGTEDVPVWWTDNVFWNAVMRGVDERFGDEFKGERLCCLNCFITKAHEAGFRPTSWRLIPEFAWTLALPERGTE